MANPYYTFTPAFVAGTKVRSDEVNTQLAAIETGFDLMPTNAEAINRGTTFLAAETGSGNSYVVTMPNTRTDYQDGDQILFRATHANTGPATVDVDTVGAVAMVRADDSPLQAGDIEVGLFISAIFHLSANHFQLINTTASYIGDLDDRVGWADEWAKKAEDSLVSTAAGGNGTTDYSALHHAAKAAVNSAAAIASASAAGISETNAGLEKTYAEEWATKAEDSLISVAAGGNGTTDYSALHHAAKAAASAGSATPAQQPGAGDGGKLLKVSATENSFDFTTYDHDAVPAANIAAGSLGTGVNHYFGASATSSAFKIPFTNTTLNAAGNFSLNIDSGSTFTYNPSTNTLVAGTFSGTLAASNVGTGSLPSGVNPYITAQGGSGAYKIAFLATTGGTSGNFALYMDSGASQFTYNPSTNTLVAGTFSGALSGNATTATSATSATTAATATNVAATGVQAGNLINGVNPYVSASGTNSNFKVPFTNTTGGSAGNRTLSIDTGTSLYYNPSSNTLFSTNLAGAGASITALNMANASSGTLAVGRGGTGVTSSTGTGSLVLSASPALTGNPTAPTQTAGNNSTRLATTAFVQTELDSNGVDILQSGTVTGAATLDITGIAATYRKIKIVFNSLNPSTDNQKFYLRVGTGAGPTWQAGTTDYTWSGFYISEGAISGESADGLDTEIQLMGNLAGGTGAGEDMAGEIDVYYPGDAGSKTIMQSRISGTDQASSFSQTQCGGEYTANTAVTGIRLLFATGNIADMNYTVYGYRNS